MIDRFHVISVMAPSKEYVRKDCPVDVQTERFAKLYEKYLPKRGRMALPFDDLGTELTVINTTPKGAALFHLEVEDVVGLGMLVLGGHSRNADYVYASHYIKRLVSSGCPLSMPPLEVESRPLFYYTLFRLSQKVEGQKWYDIADRVISKANSLGVALLRSSRLCSLQQEENAADAATEDQNGLDV